VPTVGCWNNQKGKGENGRRGNATVSSSKGGWGSRRTSARTHRREEKGVAKKKKKQSVIGPHVGGKKKYHCPIGHQGKTSFDVAGKKMDR